MEKECEKCGYYMKNHKFQDDKYNCPEIIIETQKEKSICCNADKKINPRTALFAGEICGQCGREFQSTRTIADILLTPDSK